MPKVNRQIPGSSPLSSGFSSNTPYGKGAFKGSWPSPRDMGPGHGTRPNAGKDDHYDPSWASSEAQGKEEASQKQDKEMNALKGEVQAMKSAHKESSEKLNHVLQTMQAMQAMQATHTKDIEAMQATHTKDIEAIKLTHTKDIEAIQSYISTGFRICSLPRLDNVQHLAVEALFDICKYPEPSKRPQILPAARVAYIVAQNKLKKLGERGPGFINFTHDFLIKRRELGQKFYFPKKVFEVGSSRAEKYHPKPVPHWVKGPFPVEMSQRAREGIKKVSQNFQYLQTLRNESAHTTNAFEVHFFYHLEAFTKEVSILLEEFWPFLFSDELPLMKENLTEEEVKTFREWTLA